MNKNIAFLKTSTQSLTTIVLNGLTILLPLAVLPLSDNFLVDSKFTILFCAALVVFALWAINTATKKSLQITLSPFVGPVTLLGISTIASIVMNRGYVVEHLIGFGGAYIALVLLTIFGSSIIQYKDSKHFLHLLAIPAVLLSLLTGAEMLGYGPSRIFNLLLKTQFPSSPIFSLSGSPLVTAQLLFVVLVGIAATAFMSKGAKKFLPIYGGASLILLAGMAINAYTLYIAQKTTPVFLPFGISAAIALDSLKELRFALFGFGPESFSQVYLLFKPAWLNTTNLWNVQFNQSSNVPLTLISTLGLLGLASWVFLIVQAVRRWLVKTDESIPAAAIFFAATFLQLIFPANVVLLTVQFLALIFWIAAEKNNLKDVQLHAFTVHIIKSGNETQRVPQHSNAMVYVVGIINLIIVGTLAYLIGTNTLAQFFTFQSNLAANNNNALSVYQLQQSAIFFNPYYDVYRRKYSLTNMLIATALSENTEAKADPQQVLALVQQSIREGKTAVLLDPRDSSNWLNLARIYNTLIGTAEQAEQWSAESYQQAIALAPNDPILNLELGGVLYRVGAFQDATTIFERTALLKQDWPNAFYNLANAYKQLKAYDRALAAYQQTLLLLPSDSTEYGKVKAEIDEMQKMVQSGQSTKTGGTQTQGSTQQTTPPPAAELSAPTASSPAKPALNKEAVETLQNSDIQPQQ